MPHEPEREKADLFAEDRLSHIRQQRSVEIIQHSRTMCKKICRGAPPSVPPDGGCMMPFKNHPELLSHQQRRPFVYPNTTDKQLAAIQSSDADFLRRMESSGLSDTALESLRLTVQEWQRFDVQAVAGYREAEQRRQASAERKRREKIEWEEQRAAIHARALRVEIEQVILSLIEGGILHGK